MSDGTISQDEIDALLSNSVGGAASSVPFNLAPLKNFAAGLFGTLASEIGAATGTSFDIGDATVESTTRDQLLAKLPEMVVSIGSDFSQGLSGDHAFLLSPEFAQKLIDLVNKEENATLDEMALSVVSEIVAKHSAAEIAEMTKLGKVAGIACNPPEALHVAKAMVRFPPDPFVLFSYPLTALGVSYTLWEVVSSVAAAGMMNALGAATSVPPVSAPSGISGMGGMGSMAGMGSIQPQGIPNVQGLEYPSLHGVSGASSEQGNIGLIMDVFMEMTVELGRTRKQIKEILGIGEGTIIELDKLAGEPVDILVNHKLIAKGEVVVIDENFGVRVTEILSPITQLGDLQ